METYQIRRPAALSSVPSGRNITLNFQGAGGFDGNTGYNNYGGGCHITGNSLTVSSMMQTSQQNDLDNTYMHLLRQSQNYELKNNSLIIHCQDGQELVFTRL